MPGICRSLEPRLHNTDGGCLEQCREALCAIDYPLRGGSSSKTRSSFRMGRNTDTAHLTK